MDYSQLSDFEINKRVAICCGFAPEDCEIAKLGTSIVGVEWDDETGYAIKTVDYCKKPIRRRADYRREQNWNYSSTRKWIMEGSA